MDEWRPAICAPKEVASGGRKFLTSWLYGPPQARASQENGAGAESADNRPELEEKDVLLAPKMPLCLGSVVHPDHKKFLAQAKELKAGGMLDNQIAMTLDAYLQKEFKESVAKSKGDETTPAPKAPPPITVNVVKKYLDRSDLQETKAAADSKAAGGGVTAPAGQSP